MIGGKSFFKALFHKTRVKNNFIFLFFKNQLTVYHIITNTTDCYNL